MKRYFACLMAVLSLSLLLVGCGDRMDGGMVTSSPAAVSATPVIPSMDVSLPPVPDERTDRETEPTQTPDLTVQSTAAPRAK
ncbi:MAG: hypothetical protein J5967_02740 [Oscillospiraceae bacterium]|nr:hypothetical protein [Oscillospiraceae bacterium]